MVVQTNPGRARAAIALVAAGAMLSACGQSNTYVAPTPPKVIVAKPVEQKVTRYFEGTGSAAAINSANLVARVSGFLKEIAHHDSVTAILFLPQRFDRLQHRCFPCGIQTGNHSGHGQTTNREHRRHWHKFW